MKLYPGKIPSIAKEILAALTAEEGVIEVLPEEMDEVSLDIESVLKEYVRVDKEITERARDEIANGGLDYTHLGKSKSRIAAERGVGIGEDAIDYIVRQIIEQLMHSSHVEEVFADDAELTRRIVPVLKKQTTMESDLDLEVRRQIRNLQEGTVSWEIEYQRRMDDLKRTRRLE